ncbi:hypothetical protein RB298_02110 [Priestia sp. BR_2]
MKIFLLQINTKKRFVNNKKKISQTKQSNKLIKKWKKTMDIALLYGDVIKCYMEYKKDTFQKKKQEIV